MRHTITASKGDLIAQCRVSPALSKHFESDNDINEAAERGIRMHKEISILLLRKLKRYRVKTKIKNENFNIDEQDKEIYQNILNNIKVILDFIKSSEYEFIEIMLEHKIIVDKQYIGTADLILLNHTKKICLVVDFKFGRVDIHPSTNQLKLYSYPFRDYTCCSIIIQPFSQSSFKHSVITKQEIELAYKMLLEARMHYDKGKDLEKLANAGKYCIYCPYNIKCEKYSEKLLKLLKDMNRLETLTNDELYEFYTHKKDLEIALERVENILKDKIIENGLELELSNKKLQIKVGKTTQSWNTRKLDEIKSFLSSRNVEFCDKPYDISDQSLLDEMQDMIITRVYKDKIKEL